MNTSIFRSRISACRFFVFWTLLNMLIPLAIIALIFWYLKKQTDYRNQLLNKLDTLISLQQKNADDK